MNKRIVFLFPVFSILSLNCTFHYISVKNDRYGSLDYIQRSSRQIFSVDFQRVNPSEENRASFDYEMVRQMLVESGHFTIDPKSNLVIRIESKTELPATESMFFRCLPLVTLFIFPIYQPTNHDSTFLLYNKVTGEELYRDDFHVDDYLFLGWLAFPGSVFAPLSDSLYVFGDQRDDRTQEYAFDRFLTHFLIEAKRKPELLSLLNSVSENKTPSPKIRIVSFKTRRGRDLWPEYSGPLQKALARHDISIGEEGCTLEVKLSDSFEIGSSGRHLRREIDFVLVDSSGRRVQKEGINAADDTVSISEKLASFIRNELYRPLPDGSPSEKKVIETRD